MDVPNSQGWARHRWRPPLAAVLMLGLAVLSGSAQAVEFDAAVKAPMMKDAADLKAKAREFSTRYSAVRAAAPEMLVKDARLARDQFDLKWQAQQAINERKPLDALQADGLIPRGDGSYKIDVEAHPEWQDLYQTIVALLKPANMEGAGPELINRGFRPQDVEILRNYLAVNNPEAASNAAILPLTLDFGRVVGKYDKAKRPVPDALTVSYLYQRAKAHNESYRLWIENLLELLDAQRVRVLLSTFLELKPIVIWAPDDVPAGIAALLVEIRRPDFEARAKAEMQGVTP